MKAMASGRASLVPAAVAVVALLAMGLGVHRGLAQLGEPDFGTSDRYGTRRIPDVPEDVLPKPATQPAGAAIAPREPENLLPEYARVVDREGVVVRKAVGPEGGIRTVFRSADEKLELVLLENRYLEALENATDYGRKGARLRLSGTVTVYRGVNYLLLTRVQIKQP